MRQIEYSLKNTIATTQYVIINSTDTEFLIETFIKYLATFGELSNRKDDNCKLITKSYWNKSHRRLPRSKNGYNTPYSFISGLLNNMLFRNSNNLSMYVLPGIECLSKEVHDVLYTLKEETHIHLNDVEIITFIPDVRPITFL